jgi:hypothetical protein
LLIVDDCFGEDSAKVRSAVQLAAEQSSQTCRVLRFNSAVDSAALEHDELCQGRLKMHPLSPVEN